MLRPPAASEQEHPPLLRNLELLSANKLSFELWLSVFQKHRNNFNQVGTQFVNRRSL